MVSDAGDIVTARGSVRFSRRGRLRVNVSLASSLESRRGCIEGSELGALRLTFLVCSFPLLDSSKSSMMARNVNRNRRSGRETGRVCFDRRVQRYFMVPLPVVSIKLETTSEKWRSGIGKRPVFGNRAESKQGVQYGHGIDGRKRMWNRRG